MTDEQRPNHTSPEPPEGPDSGVASENELNEVLAQASSLAAGLSEEVGTVEQPPVSEEPRQTPEKAEDPAATDLDVQLAELERLVAETDSEVDDTRGSPDEDAQVLSETRTSLITHPVPEFMEEFTRAEGLGDAAKPEPQAPAAAIPPGGPGEGVTESRSPDVSDLGAGPKPGVVGTGMLGVVGEVPPVPEGTEEPAPAEPGEPGHEPVEEVSAVSKIGRLADVMHKAAARSLPAALAVCDRAVTLLEVINRPVADRLGDSTLRVIGWIALATLGTSVIVYLSSLI
ncbi:MAG: hypothetical protein JSU86_03595 [Phycisphaerales bacterium]|nr:MAG: hypothetical protein JSU86_03595 [Phycisphaerales bacterium]